MIEIYALKCPDSHEVRYIGKAINSKKRYVAHINSAIAGSLTHKYDWIRSLLATNKLPEYELLDTVQDTDWELAENAWISHYLELGCDLTNHTYGGEGSAGWNPSDGYRKQRSIAYTGSGNPRYGKVSCRLVGSKNPMYGKFGKLNPMYGKQGIVRLNDANPMFGKFGSQSHMYGTVTSDKTKQLLRDLRSGTTHMEQTIVKFRSNMERRKANALPGQHPKYASIFSIQEQEDIIKYYTIDKLSMRSIAIMYGCSRGTISSVINSKLKQGD